MVFAENTRVIVMVTNLEENGRLKADQYWPSSGRKMYGDVSVTLRKEKDYDCFVKRTFAITKGAPPNSLRSAMSTMRKITEVTKVKIEEVIVTQFHYTGWPDFGVPSSCDELLSMILAIDKFIFSHELNDFPILTHCSAGIGRTGTFGLIHSMIRYFQSKNIDEYPNNFSLAKNLKKMRDCRCGSVQTLKQYFFCYRTLYRYFDYNNGIDEETTMNLLKEKSERLRRGKVSKKNKKKKLKKKTKTSLSDKIITQSLDIESVDTDSIGEKITVVEVGRPATSRNRRRRRRRKTDRIERSASSASIDLAKSRKRLSDDKPRRQRRERNRDRREGRERRERRERRRERRGDNDIQEDKPRRERRERREKKGEEDDSKKTENKGFEVVVLEEEIKSNENLDKKKASRRISDDVAKPKRQQASVLSTSGTHSV
eukprot:TRINITY_DN1191_c0_g1_i4.p1 TRINITY_DN1191_c0_g1~~TRINITY_DN1191_c0_g1_i4.p1  ORF type:complete len:428 (+),score=90.76 TRINITY_DN1191_c0_g1_i4:310-1593(+)